MPGTYGHYLAGVAAALLRDCEGLLRITEDLQSSPLGAGALAGTSFPIRPDRTAELLGFDAGPVHSLDAVASRDCVLRLISAASIAAVTLSRLATDFMQWTTAEFDFLKLPDELVGGSSAMPQKRNPFLLEHVQGRAASLIGAFVHASTAMHATPFTNSIAVSAESVKPARSALQDLMEMTLIVRMIVAGARPNREAMLERAVRGFTTATEFANNLVRETNMDFRGAHRLVGTVVLAAHEQGIFRLEEVAASYLKEHGTRAAENLDPARVAAMLEWGGGPGPGSLKSCLERLQQTWRGCRERKRSQEIKWRQACAVLQQEVEKRLAGAPALRVAAPH
jgi:argininosuccinate lyase